MIKNNLRKKISQNELLSSIFKPLYCAIARKWDFQSKRYWDKRYVSGGSSGDGSYGRLAEFKAEVINDFVSDNSINIALEIGCGDGNQLSLLKLPRYIGFDVSKKSIELCSKRFCSDESKSFFLYDPQYFIDKSGIFKVDLVMSLDVIYHLVENEIFEKYMHDLFCTSEKYVIIYSSNTDKQERFQLQHVLHRRFSDLIESNFPEWKLIKKIDNEFPEESFADFFIYEKKSSPEG